MLVTLEFHGGPADGWKEENIDSDFVKAHHVIAMEGPDICSLYKLVSNGPTRAVYVFDKQLLSFLENAPPDSLHRAGPD